MSIDKMRKVVANAEFQGTYPMSDNLPYPRMGDFTIGDAKKAIEDYDAVNKIWTELSSLVACTSPDGSAELDQVRLMQEKAKMYPTIDEWMSLGLPDVRAKYERWVDSGEPNIWQDLGCLYGLVPQRPHAITWEQGVAILNYVQDKLLTPERRKEIRRIQHGNHD